MPLVCEHRWNSHAHGRPMKRASRGVPQAWRSVRRLRGKIIKAIQNRDPDRRCLAQQKLGQGGSDPSLPRNGGGLMRYLEARFLSSCALVALVSAGPALADTTSS